jgi:hypothetical protein
MAGTILCHVLRPQELLHALGGVAALLPLILLLQVPLSSPSLQLAIAFLLCSSLSKSLRQNRENHLFQGLKKPFFLGDTTVTVALVLLAAGALWDPLTACCCCALCAHPEAVRGWHAVRALVPMAAAFTLLASEPFVNRMY